jgi:peptidoglycan/LPS O-acetylase OafA/YrhL
MENMNMMAHNPSLSTHQPTSDQQTTSHQRSSLRPWIRHLYLALIPSPFQRLPESEVNSRQHHSTTSYLDGLRGLAAFTVYIQHFATPFQPGMIGPPDSNSILASTQLPIIRLFYSGSFGVTLFFVISGFVLAYAPLHSLYCTGREAATNAIISSAFRRGIRIFLPTLAITAVTFLAVRFHAFDSSDGNSYKLPSHEYYNLDPPVRIPTLIAQLKDCAIFFLFRILYPASWLTTAPFTHPSGSTGDYGFQLWTISTEFYSSMFLFMVMVTFMRCRTHVRSTTVGIMSVYCMFCLRWDISLFLAGMIMADFEVRRKRAVPEVILPLSENTRATIFADVDGLYVVSSQIPQTILSATLFFVGLYIGTMPDFHADRTMGFASLYRIIPFERFWQSIGAIITVGLLQHLNSSHSTLRNIKDHLLENSAVRYLGQISFGIYLVHGFILQSIGWRTVPLVWKITGNHTIWRYELGVILAFCLLTPLILWMADIFWRYIDKPSIQFAKSVELFCM